MKRTITAIAAGTILAVSGFILPASATTTAKQVNPMLDSLADRFTSSMEAKTNASSQRLNSEQNSKDVYMADRTIRRCVRVRHSQRISKDGYKVIRRRTRVKCVRRVQYSEQLSKDVYMAAQPAIQFG